MNTPKMQAVQTSQQSCAVFGGIDRTPDAQLGHWADARNLSTELYPTMICAKNPDYANSDQLPGIGDVTGRVVAMCDADPPVFLDTLGNLHCNGHSVALDQSAKVKWKLRWSSKNGAISATAAAVSGEFSLADIESAVFPGKSLIAAYAMQTGREDKYEIQFTAKTSGTENGNAYVEFLISGEIVPNQSTRDLSEYGISIEFQNAGNDLALFYESLVDNDFCVELTIETVSAYNQLPETLIMSGANVIVFPQGIMVNAVRLASGQTIRKQDISEIPLKRTVLYQNATPATISMCRADGRDYESSEMIESATAPSDHTKIWHNTTVGEQGLYEWLESISMWERIQSTYAKINHIEVAVEKTIGTGLTYDSVIREGDVVKFTATYLPDFTDKDIEELLNGTHKVVKTLPEEDAIVVPGLLIHRSRTTTAEWTVERRLPEMDFVVSCENRLWGCRFSEADAINEIYASALGDFGNWESYQGISTDAWRASRGTPEPFTGAAVYDGKPLFFRENHMDKIYPSSAGAHQIHEFTFSGVEEGAADSLVLIENQLFYKSRLGVMVYSGSVPRVISGRLGDLKFSGGSAGRNRKSYCLCTSLVGNWNGEDHQRVTLIYDMETAEWQIRNCSWQGKPITYKDSLFYMTDGPRWASNGVFLFERKNWYGAEEWWAETAPQAIHYWTSGARGALTAHKWISYLRIRFRVPDKFSYFVEDTRDGPAPPPSSTLKIFISYDEAPYELKRELSCPCGSRLRTVELAIMPRRRDNLRLRLEGTGPVQIFDINYRMERSEGGH